MLTSALLALLGLMIVSVSGGFADRLEELEERREGFVIPGLDVGVSILSMYISFLTVVSTAALWTLAVLNWEHRWWP